MEEVQLEYQFLNIIAVGDYTPEEESTQYDSDLGGYPGSHAEFSAQKVYLLNDEDKQDILNILSYEQRKEIEELVLTILNK